MISSVSVSYFPSLKPSTFLLCDVSIPCSLKAVVWLAPPSASLHSFPGSPVLCQLQFGFALSAFSVYARHWPPLFEILWTPQNCRRLLKYLPFKCGRCNKTHELLKSTFPTGSFPRNLMNVAARVISNIHLYINSELWEKIQDDRSTAS